MKPRVVPVGADQDVPADARHRIAEWSPTAGAGLGMVCVSVAFRAWATPLPPEVGGRQAHRQG